MALSARLHEVFATVGFAYLINAPLSFDHEDVFGMAKEFFYLPEETKMTVAKKTFRKSNTNTYRGQVKPIKTELLQKCQNMPLTVNAE